MRYAFLLILSFYLYSGVPEIPFEDIQLQRWKTVKKVNPHTVYYSNHEYMKIWNRGSWHFEKKQNVIFLRALKAGFFQGIAPLKGVIMENEECVGYITKECKPISKNEFTITRFKDLKKKKIPNHDKVIDLFRLYKDRILATGYCFRRDFRGSWNMGILGSKCYYFDLDHIAIVSHFRKEEPVNSAEVLFVFDGNF